MGTYDKSIIAVLADVGSGGISVRKLAMHVYNQHCSFFERPDFKEVHRCVQQFLVRNSKSATSLIERCDRRGHYRLNTSQSAAARQLIIDFAAEEEQTKSPTPSPQDLSLSLFD